VVTTELRLKRVRKQRGFLVEGYLYAYGDRYFLVFTAADGTRWDACDSDALGASMGTYRVRGGEGIEDCLARLERALERGAA
jgi:hypothetical protein